MPTPKTPTVNQLCLKSYLTRFRNEAGLSQDEAGRALFPTMKPVNARAKIAQIETGKSNFRTARGLRDALDLYGVTDENMREFLFEAYEHLSQQGRWKGVRATFDKGLWQLIDLEEDSSVIYCAGSEIMPGLLQCREYVEALFARLPAAQFAPSVQARLNRAANTFMRPENPVRFNVVLSQSYLERYASPDRDVMKAQMTHLLAIGKAHSNVQIQVLPWETPQVMVHDTASFQLMSIPSDGLAGPRAVVYIDSTVGNTYIDDPTTVSEYTTRWERLTSSALSVPDSTNLIKEYELKFS